MNTTSKSKSIVRTWSALALNDIHVGFARMGSWLTTLRLSSLENAAVLDTNLFLQNGVLRIPGKPRLF